MSDRREAVAAALVAALGKYGSIHDAGYGFTTLTLYHDDMPRIASRLLDAMDAEPTEADVDRGELSYQISAAILPTVLDFIQFDSDRDQEAFCDRLADKAAGMAITVFANHAARKAGRE